MTVVPLPLAGAQRCPFGPPPDYAELREHHPVSRVECPTGIEAWLVTRYADVREVLGDPQRFSTRPGTGSHILAGYAAGEPGEGDFPRMDGPEHLRFRRHMAPELSNMRRVAQLRPMVRRVVDERIDALATTAPPAELYADFAKPVTTAVIAGMLDVPAADHPLFQHAAEALFAGASSGADVAAAMQPLFEYLYGMVAARRAAPGEDVLSRMIVRSDQTERPFTDTELVRMSAGLLVAGYDTTASMIAHGVLALLEHPQELARLRHDPTLAAAGAEELVRYLGVGGGLLRAATEDTTIAGQPIKAGDYVVVAIQSANRDPALYADGDRLDIGRPTGPHVGFGHGPHQCVGQQLARLELTAVLAALPRRIPTLRLAVPFADIRFKVASAVLGPVAVPVTWDGIEASGEGGD
ncbi:cytochrome P450 [Dactylosporangium matsuzakiense]|uniref:Cytochrome P450 n=1 Tax=Dactylosporangium matsuzakiense TaxID=53360 RepID=A0A9W6KMU7_9ACTN|nr:cytochrome P450 [Dactylosporangium matsuzakiense]GLL02214.1 cytochrome P450 [Dactylosporangium matsuzakiense]